MSNSNIYTQGMSYLTSEAKAKLSSTIRELRDRLLTDIHNTADSIYLLSLPIEKAGLAEEQKVKRSRLEQWLKEQDRDSENARLEAEKLAAATFLNRLVVIKQLEALELIKPKVVTGGWQSSGYREFREFAPDLCKDDSEGFSTLLGLLYDEWALDLPGLFGKVGITELLPVSSVTLRVTIETLNNSGLDSAWLDDTTLGWVYQFWNDPDRKALDEKINNAGKIEHHEIAAKTQIFTERYMVEWLLQNSLNQQWLAICAKNGWTPEVKANGVLDDLEKRKESLKSQVLSLKEKKTLDFRFQTSDLESQWKYWVSQPLLPEAIEAAPKSIRDLKLIDPAVGSSHFLVIAFSLLFSFYKEEAQHRGETWTDTEIAESIIENNLHGVDLDSRAVQIGAAALFLKAKFYCRDAHPRWMNLVASNLGLSSLPIESPEVNELQLAIYQATGIPADLIAKIIQALHGADHLGSLLKIDEAIENAIAEYETKVNIAKTEPVLPGFYSPQLLVSTDEAKNSILTKLSEFLAKCTSGDDLGLRLRGEQLAAGVRFVEIVKENKYDLVCANPPYLGQGKIEDKEYIEANYPDSKADLCTVFLQRGTQLTKPYGLSAMITMRGWMFIKEYESLRSFIVKEKSVFAIADLHFGAFPELKDVSVTMPILMNAADPNIAGYFIRPVKSELIVRNLTQIDRNIAGLISPHEIFIHHLEDFKVVEGQPFVYWWDDDFLKRYAATPKLEEESDVKVGMNSTNNKRFLRLSWEIEKDKIFICKYNQNNKILSDNTWSPYVKGAAGKVWFEPLNHVVYWNNLAFELRVALEVYQIKHPGGYFKNSSFYFRNGISYSTIGSSFTARARRFKSVFDVSGSSVFPEDIPNVTALMNSNIGRDVLTALNPTINFQTSDVKRLPLFPIELADEIFDRLDRAFSEHEAARETSVEFRQPAPSPWNYAQQWAQQAVDRPAGKPLPEYEPVYDAPLPTHYVSYAIGVALGRFSKSEVSSLKSEEEDKSKVSSLKSQGSNTEVLTGSNQSEKNQTLNSKLQLEESNTDIRTLDQKFEEKKTLDFRFQTSDFTKHSNFDTTVLPNGILYLSAYSEQDSLEHSASQVIKTVWNIHGEQIAANKPLRKWLRESFFKDVHLGMYEKRPIYFPLSSAKKNFVALINIHCWTDNTLQTLLAEHLKPELTKLEGELKDLREAETSGNKSNQNRYASVQKLGEELQNFIDLVAECAERGAPIAKPKDTPRETEARFQMNLDDGVMINSAALWTLLEPQWKDPKTWWSELCNAKGKKDYDWSHLAARYFPKRVDAKCQQDPSLAVAHGCFWQYHPEKAYQWELRLQDEISEDFTIDEVNSNELRQAFEIEHPNKVAELKTAELKRRERKEKSEV